MTVAKEKGAVPTLIIAHRGASAEQPENTLAAFRRALALGVDGIELDVRVTRDGVAVVFHDAMLRRLTGVSGTVAGKTWTELAALRVRRTETIPRLAAVLRLTRGRAVVQIEIKAGVPLAPIVRAIKAVRATAWVVLASFDAGLIRKSHRLARKIPRMLITEGKGPRAGLTRQLAECEAVGLSVNHQAVRSAAWVRYFQDRGFAVWCWTVNDARRARRLAGWGVDALLGDDPALLRSVV